MTFSANPCVLRVRAGSLDSAAARFSVPDGTALSASAGVSLTPVVTNAAAAAHFTRTRGATVYVTNVKPALLSPQATDTHVAYRGQPYAFDWNVSDVARDLETGVLVTWRFGDGTASQTVTGACGTVHHTFQTLGDKMVSVTARDKDGALKQGTPMIKRQLYLDQSARALPRSRIVVLTGPRLRAPRAGRSSRRAPAR